MKKIKDPRINATNTQLKEYCAMFFILAAFNGFHMWLYQEFYTRGILAENPRFVINVLMIYTAVAAALFTVFTAFVRQISWDLPTRKLGEAASKVAKGDLTIRIAPLRKDGRKDNVEVMFDDFNTMVQELQSIETMKSDFIANVSHEIKTPLAVIQNYATVLQGSLHSNGTLTDEERSDYIKTIIEASQKLSALVSNILRLSKLENQGLLPKANQFNLGEQLRRCAVAFEELWEQKNIIFDSEIEDIIVCYDENMLEIVWNNLLSNAIKFTDPGGKITMKLTAKDGSQNKVAQVSISDTGCGMDSETQKRIFDKFYQGDTSHSHEGNGLGLALVKQTIGLLDGTIAVESRLGQGSTFTVCLKI